MEATDGAGFDLRDLGDRWKATLGEATETGEVSSVKGRGRPAGSGGRSGGAGVPSGGSVDAVALSGDELRSPVKVAGKILTRIAGVSNLTADEVDELSEALTPVVNKYVGPAFVEHAPEITLALVLLKVGEPRFSEFVRNRSKEKAKAEGTWEDDGGATITDEF